jgi:hypothetical protein
VSMLFYKVATPCVFIFSTAQPVQGQSGEDKVCEQVQILTIIPLEMGYS